MQLSALISKSWVLIFSLVWPYQMLNEHLASLYLIQQSLCVFCMKMLRMVRVPFSAETGMVVVSIVTDCILLYDS